MSLFGLGGGGGFFGSGAKNSQTFATTNNYTNEAGIGAENSGEAVSGQGNVVNFLDQGAISGAMDISGAALDLGAQALKTGQSINSASLDFGSSAINSAFDFGGDAMTLARALNGDALGLVSSTLNKALDNQKTLVDTNIQGLTGLASQVSQSSSQNTNESITRIIQSLAVVGAIAFIFTKVK